MSSTNPREEILAAALDLLRTVGHGGLTVRKVADRAGCSTIGVYTWFGGKDGLVDAILIDGFTDFAKSMRASRSLRGPLGRLAGQARAYRAWALAHPTHYQVMFLQAVPGHQPAAEAAKAGLAAYNVLFDEVMAAQARGEMIDGDAHAIAMTMWGTMHGLVLIEVNQADPDVPSEVQSTAAVRHQRAFDFAIETLRRGLVSAS
jgi:AcrR family transcriptional regulator